MPAPRWLQHPLTRGLDVDDPRTTALRRQILASKGFLMRLYREWYEELARELPGGPEPVLELGAGAGFLSEVVPGVLASDVFPTESAEVVLDAADLPFRDGSLSGVVMTNVLHHVARPLDLFAAATRCVRPGGVIVMLEPWVTPWSRLVYTRFHDEPFDCGATSWELDAGGPLSRANGALPWILFERDRSRFERAVPAWRIRSIRPTMPLRYLLSGGLSLRAAMPAWAFGACRALDRVLERRASLSAMFAYVVLERLVDPAVEPVAFVGIPPAGAC